MMLVYERLIIQATVSDSLAGRVFGTKDALTAWAFAISFVVAGAAVPAVGPQAVLIASGAGVIAIGAATGWGCASPMPSASIARPTAFTRLEPVQLETAATSASGAG